MAITRSQIARQLMQEGGAPRQGYFLGKIVKKFKEDIIPNELKSPAGAAAAALALNQFGVPFTKGIGGRTENIGKGSISNIFKGIGNVFTGGGTDGFEGEESPRPTYSDQLKKIQEKGGDAVNFLTKKRLGTDKSIASLLLSPEALSIGAGLVAGAFSKKEDDPLYTGQSVGLNLSDIRKLANISDQKTGAAIGLNFLPDTKFRKFSPTEMAATYAANQPVDFTEQRESADKGGIMGQFKMASAPDPAAERNSFLEMMSERFYGKPLKDLTPDEFMDLEEALDDMGMKPRDNNMKMASAVLGDESDDIAQELFGKRFKDLNPAELEEFFMHLDNLEKKFMKRDSKENMKMASAVLGGEEDDISYSLFGKPYKELTPDEIREFQEEMDRLEKKFMKRDFKKNRTMAAGGGIMNLGGMEMDLRGGGFVPIGAKEKADDVPARLSKNEFVFTADAVRAAGGGSVDKGADKMYATMKALENKVA